MDDSAKLGGARSSIERQASHVTFIKVIVTLSDPDYLTADPLRYQIMNF